MSSNTLLDNSTEELMMCNVLKRNLIDSCFNELLIATGYWDLPGMVIIYDELKEFLMRDDTKLRLLIGKEPLVRTYQQKNPQTKEIFPKDFIEKDINDLDLKQEYQSVVDLLLNYCTAEQSKSKIEIRIYGQGEIEQFLHAKCYIFKGQRNAVGIIGSSNFTQKGLEGNAELNYLETDYKCVAFKKDEDCPNIKGHISWFTEKWEVSSLWNNIFLEEILKKSPIGQRSIKAKQPKPLTLELTPFYAYIKLLQNQWGDVLDANWKSTIEAAIPSSMMKLDYQIEAVNQGYSIMQKHGGFILSDVVGLGKTVVGILIIKRFLAEAGDKSRNILVVTPPAIKKAWINTINDFDANSDDKLIHHVSFITNGSIGNLVAEDIADIDDDSDVSIIPDDELESVTSKDYGLVIVDESHKFRNSDTAMYKQLDSLIASSYPRPYVMLISATPQNNKPDDLKNQIYLFQRERQNTTLDTIEGRKLDTFFSAKSKLYSDIIKRKDTKDSTPEQKNADSEELKKMSAEIRQKIVEPLIVRRTRSDIESYFKSDLELQKIKFPKIKGPEELWYQMDAKLSELFFDTINIIAPEQDDDDSSKLNYFRYRAIEFLKNESDRKTYEKRNLTAKQTSKQLANIMQILLVKRLESSFAAFKKSISNFKQYYQNMFDMLQDDCVFICPDIDINKIFLDNKNKREIAYKIIREQITKKQGNNKEYKSSDFKLEYSVGLRKDIELIDDLLIRWSNESFDPKLDYFKQIIDTKLFSDINSPSNPSEKKLVIFTEAKDTVTEIARHISRNHKVLAITSENRNKLSEAIQANFDANFKGERKNDFDVIVTTDVLAEGINLHRCNVILNYDTPWNSTRLMQRIGRVNRIGSCEEFVHVFNFFPSSQGDFHIDLVQKAYTKLQSFHSLFGGDNQVFSHDEDVQVHKISPFALDDTESPFIRYIDELKQFKSNNPDIYAQLEALPDGAIAAKHANTPGLICHVKTENKGGLFFLVNKEFVASEIPLLSMIQMAECDFSEPSLLPVTNSFTALQGIAVDAYKAFVQKIATANDQTKLIKQAESIIYKKLSSASTYSQATSDILLKARSLVKNGDIQLIRQIIDIDKYIENELFTDDASKFDFIVNIINQRLHNLHNTTTKQTNTTPLVVLSIELI